jgi:hypothetical protein
MATSDGCQHLQKASGVFSCDVSREGQEASIYSAKLRIRVCEDCGHIEFEAESYRDLCRWLKSREATRSAVG